MKTETNIKKYYNDPKKYLFEHQSFFESSDTKKDIFFITKALDIKKNDRILDIGCGQGRHANLFAQKKYEIDGIDFSKTLLKIAKKNIPKKVERKTYYYETNIEKINIDKKYNKVYWFFSDFANINIKKAIKSINKTINDNGDFLIDTDNIFRIKRYLSKNKTNNLYFSSKKSILIDKINNLKVPYLTLASWKKILKSNSLVIKKVYGDYNFEEYSKNSSRLIMIIKKPSRKMV